MTGQIAGAAMRVVSDAPLQFHRAEVLAPMVRASTLPLRLESLRYGADYVWGEEVVDRKIIDAVRVENAAFGLTDFVSPREKVAVFSTCPEERARVLFQLGTANAALASQAALLVCRDVRGIDVNMGCPKSFSVKGGMGAALLSTPDIAADILKTLRRTLPSSCALTCKIRMLPTTAQTRDFMQLCERSGAEAVTVHMRQRGERPAEPARWEEILRLWDAVKVPVLANGDFFNRRQIDEFWKHCRAPEGFNCESEGDARWGPAGVMVARGAMWNPSIFCRNSEAPSFEEVVKKYTRTAVLSNSTYQNTKWVLASMLAGGTGVTPPIEFRGTPIKPFNQNLSRTKNMGELCEMVGEPHDGGSHPAQAHTTAFYRNFVFPDAVTAQGGAAAAAARKRGPETPCEEGGEKRARAAGGDEGDGGEVVA